MSRVSLFAALAMLLAAVLTACGGGGTQQVVIYSPHGEEILGPIEVAFETAYPEIDLVYLNLPTAKCSARIRAESNNPQCDVWWGGPSGEFITAEQAGLLAPYAPSWINHATADTRSPSNSWHSNWRTPEVILYNSTRVSAEESPKDWDDVLDPKWTGRVVIRDPLQSGTMKTIYGAMILRAGNEDAGFDWLRKLDKQNGGEYAGNPEIMFSILKGGGADVTLWNMADGYIQRETNGLPLAWNVPTSGTPVLLEGIAIVKNAPNRSGAETFFEWVTSAEQLADQSHRFHRIPIERADLDRAALPQWMREQNIMPMEIDWVAFAEQSTRWLERWKNEVRGSGAN